MAKVLVWNPITERVEEVENTLLFEDDEELERLYIEDDRLDIEDETGLDLPDKE